MGIGSAHVVDDQAERQWQASPRKAMAIRATVAIVPFVLAWFVVVSLAGSFYRPQGGFGAVVWIAQAMTAGIATSMATERLARRALPLASLYAMTLVFPDQAPSRFSVALRSGTVRHLRARLREVDRHGLGQSESEATARAVELIRLLSHHDRLTRGHTERVRAYSDLIAKELGLSQSDRDRLAWSAILHDIGKLKVPADILNKGGQPDDTEWAILKTHPKAAADLLAPLETWLGEWIRAVDEHHERWDGTGYPAGLAGTEISLAGRITAVADAYDVITSHRSYKRPLSAPVARRELLRNAGTQFDPVVVRAFLNASLRRRRFAGPLASLAALPGVANLSSHLSTVSAVAAGTVATVGTVALHPIPSIPAELAFAPPVTITATSDTSVSILEAVDRGPVPSSTASSTTVETIAATPATEAESTTTAALPTTASSQVPATTAPPATTTTQPPATTEAPTTTITPATTTTSVWKGPTAMADAASVEEGKTVEIGVLDNDAPGAAPLDVRTLEIIVAPTAASGYRVHEGQVHYGAEDNYVGSDSLVYQICDTSGLCHSATVTITVFDD